MEPQQQQTGGSLSGRVAVTACAGMAVLYVGILYAPTLILRLPNPSSLTQFMIRRFLCAAVSSVVSVFLSAFLLFPVRSWEASDLFGAFGLRLDHGWQAVVFPLLLTSLMYAGSLVLKFLLLVESWREHVNEGGGPFFYFVKETAEEFVTWISSTASNILAWRNYVVAPLTEELVFRACMIPVLLCGGFRPYTVIFICPILFSLSHLNHWMEIYSRNNYSLLKASMAISLQLGYTVIFGSYASFLFIRTRHLLAPLVAHVLCNFMGLPVLVARGKGVVTLAFLAGFVSFILLLFPVTRPDLYNTRMNNCRCWQGYCSWS